MTVASLRARTLVPALPRWGEVGVVVAASAFVALMAQVSVPLPFSPVPITGQTFAVLLVGAALGARRGAAALALYLLEGALGLPVFAGGSGGLTRLLGPTGGYLVGFVAMAWVVGALAERNWDRRWRTAWLAFLAGEVVLYLCGLPWLARFVGGERALALGLWPFVPGDILKAVLAGVALPAAWRWVGFGARS